MADRLRLRIALGQHDHVRPLREGRVRSSRVEFEFVEIEPLPRAFRQFVNGDDIDVAELAVVTHLLAHHYGRPITGIAIPLWSRLPHTNLVCAADRPIAAPAELDGTRIGVRSYAQTSGVWVRGVLASDYGVDLDSISWGTMEDAHLPEFVDPANSVRHPASPGLRDRMMAGEFAAIMGERIVDPAGVRTVIPDATEAAHAWIARTGIEPINHILAVRNRLTDAHPWLAAELFELFDRAREIAVNEGAAPPPPYGLERCRASLQLAMRCSAEQRITPRLYDVDEMFHPL